MKAPAVKERFRTLGATPIGGTRGGFREAHPRRLREMGTGDQGRRHQGGIAWPGTADNVSSRVPAAARPLAAEGSSAARGPATPTPMCSARRRDFPTPTTAATRRPTRRSKNTCAMLDTVGCSRGVLVQGSAHGRDNGAMLDALARHRSACAASQWPTPMCRRRSSRAGMRSACAACGSIISSAAAPCTTAAACRSMPRRCWRRRWRSSAGTCSCGSTSRTGRHVAAHQGDRPPHRDRPHGPHRCRQRDGGAGLPEPAPAPRRRRLLGQGVRRPSA